MHQVAIVGIGLYPFGRHDGISALDMGAAAVNEALHDAGVTWGQIQFAYGGSLGMLLGHDSPQGDVVLGKLGLTGLPFVNVVNGCATAGSALSLAATKIASGEAELGVVLGFDKHPRGHFNADPAGAGIGAWYGEQGLYVTTQFFAMKIARYMHDYGISESTLAKVAAKAYRNGGLNPKAFRRTPLSEEEILSSPMINHPLRQYMFCSPDEGAGAVVVCRADRAHLYKGKPVRVRATALRTRQYGAFEVFNPSLPATRHHSPTVDAARAVFEKAGIEPKDVDVAQIQDSESGAEVMHMAECGLVADGEQEAMIQAGETEIGGRLPINTDGGLLANGEPIAASGMRQIHEIVLQLRGDAGPRQVPGEPKVGFTQVYGAPGVSACSLLTI